MSAVTQLLVVIMQYVKMRMVRITAPVRKVIRHPLEKYSSFLVMAHTVKVNYILNFFKSYCTTLSVLKTFCLL